MHPNKSIISCAWIVVATSCMLLENVFTAIVLIGFLFWYFDFLNVSVVLDCPLGPIIVLLKLLNATESSIRIVSSLAFLAHGIVFHLLAYPSTITYKDLNATSIVIFRPIVIFVVVFLLSNIFSFSIPSH